MPRLIVSCCVALLFVACNFVSAAESELAGDWALELPGGEAGWLAVRRDDDRWSAELLWGVGSARPIADLQVADGVLSFTRAIKRPLAPADEAAVNYRFTAQAAGDRMTLARTPVAGGEGVEFSGRRMPPVPPRPDLSAVRFGPAITLFNGRDLTGWRVTDPQKKNGWSVRDGVLCNDTPKTDFGAYGEYANLRTEPEFRHFRLTIEFQVPPGGNSGIYLRGQSEVQVVDRDSRMQGINGPGALFGRIVPTLNAGKPGDAWQRYEITFVARHVTVVLNGQTVIDNQPVAGPTGGALSADVTRPGPIMLQGDHTAVRYRNITLEPVAETAAPSARPNIVVLLTDDHSVLDSQVYGAHDVRTPNMQRLADRGLTFDRAFVASPSCAPSRAALLTGLMPSRNGAEANHSRPRAEIKKLPAYFQELGYEVVAFGKVGHYSQTAEYGFDRAENYGYHEDVCIANGVKWLRERRSDRPLCLFLGTNWPHVPWPESGEGYEAEQVELPRNHVDTPETRNARAAYYAAVARMDADLGRALDAADEVLGDNTLFLTTADHGAQWPFGKWNCYDTGIRVPLIAAWPGKIPAGKRTAAMVSWVDLLPTLVEAAGGTPPAELDGRSFLAVLTGAQQEHRDRIFTVHSADGDKNVYPIRSIRSADWKYIRNLHPEFYYTTHIDFDLRPGLGYFKTWARKAMADPTAAAIVERYHVRPREELYDLVADPHESHNLAADPAHAERLAALRGELDDWMKSQGDGATVFGKPRLVTDPNRDEPPPAKKPARSSAR